MWWDVEGNKELGHVITEPGKSRIQDLHSHLEPQEELSMEVQSDGSLLESPP